MNAPLTKELIQQINKLRKKLMPPPFPKKNYENK